MHIRTTFLSALAILLCGLHAPEARAAYNDGGPLVLKHVTGGLARPIFVTHAPGDTNRLFIAEQREDSTARVRIYLKSSGELLATPFVTISPVSTRNEEGLLGLAFHPGYQTNGCFYTYSSFRDSVSIRSRIHRFTVSADPDIADPGSANLIMTIVQAKGSHNAGWMGFNPVAVDNGQATDNPAYFLYIASGDGGAKNDTGDGHDPLIGNGQSLHTRLGKMLRVDVGRDGNLDAFPPDDTEDFGIPSTNPYAATTNGLGEIWAYGLRNPWRCSFDRETGDLWIGDVGQGYREELNFQPADLAAQNYGWRLREGFIATPTGGVGGPPPPDNVDPVLVYPREQPGTEVINGEVWGRSIICGYVYRGASMPWLRGTFFFSDYVSSHIWTLRYDAGSQTVTEYADRFPELQPDTGTLSAISSFGEDAEGELYVTTLGGNVFRITQSDYDLWRSRVFSVEEIATESTSGPGADWDGDGKTTVEEFIVGSDPLLADGPLPFSFAILPSQGSNAYLTLSLDRSPQSTSTVSIVGETGPAVDQLTTNTAIVLQNTATNVVVRDTVPSAAAPQRFGRLRFHGAP